MKYHFLIFASFALLASCGGGNSSQTESANNSEASSETEQKSSVDYDNQIIKKVVQLLPESELKPKELGSVVMDFKKNVDEKTAENPKIKQVSGMQNGNQGTYEIFQMVCFPKSDNQNFLVILTKEVGVDWSEQYYLKAWNFDAKNNQLTAEEIKYKAPSIEEYGDNLNDNPNAYQAICDAIQNKNYSLSFNNDGNSNDLVIDLVSSDVIEYYYEWGQNENIIRPARTWNGQQFE